MAGLLSLLIAAAALSLPPSTPDPSDPVDKILTLDNGLKVFLFERRNVPLINIVAAVNAGSKDETGETSGLTHLLEHYVLFRGTEARSGNQVALDIRDHGATFNAHTGQDLTLFEISLPAEHYEFALRNQREIIFDLKISAAELEDEKEVVLEEIRQIEDDPFRLGAALVLQSLLPGHPYGRPVHGEEQAIKNLDIEDFERFYRRFFVSNNASLAVVGDLPLAGMEAKVREIFGSLPRGEDPSPPPERPQPLKKTVEITRELDVSEGYLVIGTLGPDYNDPGQYASDVLAQALGQGINPMLIQALRGGRRDLVNSAQMIYIALKRAGVFLVYLTLEPGNMEAAKRETIAFLRRTRNENFSPADVMGDESALAYDYLSGAKNALRFIVQQAWESGLGLARSMAVHLLLNDVEGRIDYLERIDALRSTDLRQAAAANFSRNEYAVAAVVPKKK